MIQDEPLVLLSEVATELKININTLYRAIADGKLTAIKIGRGYQTKKTWVQVYLDSLTVNVPKEKEPVDQAGRK